MKKRPYRIQMWAVLRDGEPYMVLPDIDTAEAHYGSLSLNGFSKCKWKIQQVTVIFPHQTATERRKCTARAVQATVELNRLIACR